MQLDETKPIEINHSKRKYDAVTSISHPGHGYTHSGKSIITLPKGKHMIQFDPIKTGKPILIRIMKKLYPKLEGIVQSIIPNDSVKTVELSIGEKKRQYLMLEPNEKITIRLEELSRTVNLKGFRPGKVPIDVLKRQFGKAIYGEVLEKVLKGENI